MSSAAAAATQCNRQQAGSEDEGIDVGCGGGGGGAKKAVAGVDTSRLPLVSRLTLSRHCATAPSLWLAVDGLVVDVTDFAESHPGSAELLYEFAGADATEAFKDVAHSAEAKRIVRELAVGRLKD